MTLRLFHLLSFLLTVHAFLVPNTPRESSRLLAQNENSSSSRRRCLETLLISSIGTVLPAFADEPSAFDAVRRELNSPDGGIAYMQRCLDEKDFTGLLEFTKTYDQVLRKGVMGKAKKTLTEDLKDEAIKRSNAVTFDLIGMNRSSRPGKENAKDVGKYLQELRDDVQTFLDLETK